MEVDDLKLFVRIAQLRSISAAARDRGITPAGASARLVALENSSEPDFSTERRGKRP